MDYGLISLLVLQLGACLGTLIAWLSMRRELDAVRALSHDVRGAETNFKEQTDRTLARIATCEGITQGAHNKAEEVRKSLASLKETTEANTSLLNTLRGKIAAETRWEKHRKEDAEPPTAPEAPLFPPAPPPLTSAPEPSSFGRRAL